MSIVFVASDNTLGRQVVIKVLPYDLAASVSVDRFKREIMLSAALQHPHIVPVLSAGQAEQAAADPNTDHRADLYALGVVGYEMLVGAPPFYGRTPQALLAAQLTEAPKPISSRRYDVPPALADLLMRMMEKDPAKRPRNATEVA